jgi:hypothetical protein
VQLTETAVINKKIVNETRFQGCATNSWERLLFISRKAII